MKKYVYAALIVLLAGELFLAGSWYGHRKSVAEVQSGTRRILHYVDPMNPAHTSKEPGLAPCGMKMEPVYADGQSQTASSGAAGDLLAGTVNLDFTRQQRSGVEVVEVKKAAPSQTLRWLGKVAADETRIYRIQAPVDGRIVKALPQAPGSRVRTNEVLASYYSPDFLHSAQVLVYGLNAEDNLLRQKGGVPATATNAAPASELEKNTGYSYADQLAKFADADQLSQSERAIKLNIDALRNLGMGDVQISELMKSRRTPLDRIDLVSPVDGFLLSRDVSTGQNFMKGAELFRVADLSRVWIMASVFANDAEYVQPGQSVRVKLAHQQKEFTAVIAQAAPQFDAATRTLQMRLEAQNPGFLLKPDMLVDLEVSVSAPAALTIAADAILDAGQAKTVFVDRGQGVFEPLVVETGRRWGGQVEILSGLMEGERIVTSGNFLVDSESRMRVAALGGTGKSAIDPVCGMKVDESKARQEHRCTTYQSSTYYFCMEACMKRFTQAPETFIVGSGHAESPHGHSGNTTATGTASPVQGAHVSSIAVSHGLEMSHH